MATSIHIPKPLLDAVDRKARALRISRNQVILRALERAMAPGADWSPGFLERLSEVDERTSDAVTAMAEAIHAARRSKRPRPM